MGVDYFNCGHCDNIGSDMYNSYLQCKGQHFVCNYCLDGDGFENFTLSKCQEETCDCNCTAQTKYSHDFECNTCKKEIEALCKDEYIITLENRIKELEKR